MKFMRISVKEPVFIVVAAFVAGVSALYAGYPRAEKNFAPHGGKKVSAVVDSDSVAFVRGPWKVAKLGHGAVLRTAQVRMWGTVQSFSVLSYPAKRFHTAIGQAVGLETTGCLAGKLKADFAINGSYFNMKTGVPVTYTLVDGDVKQPVTSPDEESLRVNGIVAMGGFEKKTGWPVNFKFCSSASYDSIPHVCTSALAAGPMLVSEGRIPDFPSGNGFFADRHPRSMMGKRPDGDVVMVVIDGRSAGQAAGATIAEAAYVARMLGLSDAINLDGGGSSALWVREKGVVSHPSDNGAFDHAGERKVSNIIYARWVKP